MTTKATVAGSLLALGFAAGLPLMLGSLPPSDDLSVEISTTQPFLLVDRPDRRVSIASVVGPADRLERVKVRDIPAAPSTGINLRTWRVVYGHRWEREVTLPTLAGPFDKEGSDICDFSVKLGAGLFDTSGAGAGLKAAVHARLKKQFPRSIGEGGVSITFPEVAKDDLRIELLPGRAHIALDIALADGTKLTAGFDARIGSRGGSPVVRRITRAETSWTGPTREQARRAGANAGAEMGGGAGALLGFLLGGPVGAFVGGGIGADVGSEYGEAEANRIAEGRANQEITKTIDAALSELTFGLESLRRPLALVPGRPADLVHLKLAADPSLSPSGIAFPLCARVSVAAPKVNDDVPGSPHFTTPTPAAGAPAFTPAAADPKNTSIELTVDANGINHALYFLWQSGWLRELGQSSAVLDALPATIRDLAFDVAGFDPGLPPTLGTDNPAGLDRGIPVLLGDVALGAWDGRRVRGHGSVILDVTQAGDNLDLSAELRHITVDCVALRPGGRAQLLPCLSDLLPAARETLSERPLRRRLRGGDLLGRLPRDPFAGMQITWSNPSAEARANPPRLTFRVTATTAGAP